MTDAEKYRASWSIKAVACWFHARRERDNFHLSIVVIQTLYQQYQAKVELKSLCSEEKAKKEQ